MDAHRERHALQAAFLAAGDAEVQTAARVTPGKERASSVVMTAPSARRR